jgi:hypothetical protein
LRITRETFIGETRLGRKLQRRQERIFYVQHTRYVSLAVLEKINNSERIVDNFLIMFTAPNFLRDITATSKKGNLKLNVAISEDEIWPSTNKTITIHFREFRCAT